ncbi:hypothetical protein NSK_005266 [Nannochloropsis salina CCMP1776]|uniref:Uncharacterized protein n=1 Tax=Nannochloropsis salina CCMP1776 TaxID=1027361 RepID=A0A4D9CWV6_9STRA|nr:hypothetical protein NSK_005266 [Nannochloropsis salina CCMP1776]|eukprot:TFJ83426.1 hypothetical protein NSK_005266 [Nannochloropsis salina CCMP1776]
MFALRRTLVGTSPLSRFHQGHRRAFTSPSGGTNPWLNDKSLYPLLGIVGLTVLVGVWYGPYYHYKSPDKQAPMRRRTSVLTQKEPHEAGKPFGEELYKKSEDLTKGIYGVTVKDTETVKDEEKGKL